MDLSRLNTPRVLLGGVASLVLIVSVLFLPWFSIDVDPDAQVGTGDICGAGETSCTGWETFPINRWLFLLAALAPLILGWILVRGHKLSWAPGEMTMVVGFAALVLIGYNGIIDKPGIGNQETGVSLSYGYFLALLATLAMAATGFMRSQESGGKQARKAPGTV